MKENALRWPNGKARALTFSWDDCVTQDRRLLELMRKYGIKGTFNLNSGEFGKSGSLVQAGVELDHSHVAAEEVRSLYAGQEVAAHTVTHPHILQLDDEAYLKELTEDCASLEALTGTPMRGMAYPYGENDDRIRKLTVSCGMHFARGIRETGDFSLPVDPMDWACTCHCSDMDRYIDAFLSDEGIGGLFSVWGHSYELDLGDGWRKLEEGLARLSGHADVWYATNGEVFDYLESEHVL